MLFAFWHKFSKDALRVQLRSQSQTDPFQAVPVRQKETQPSHSTTDICFSLRVYQMAATCSQLGDVIETHETSGYSGQVPVHFHFVLQIQSWVMSK